MRLGPLYVMNGHGVTWFRIFGYGLWVALDHEPLFSERYGYRRVFRVGRLAFKVLKP